MGLHEPDDCDTQSLRQPRAGGFVWLWWVVPGVRLDRRARVACGSVGVPYLTVPRFSHYLYFVFHVFELFIQKFKFQILNVPMFEEDWGRSHLMDLGRPPRPGHLHTTAFSTLEIMYPSF